MAVRASSLESDVYLRIKAYRLPEPEREYRFDAKRKWRFDFAWPAARIALECEGGTWVRGRHTRGAGYERDVEKYNAATAAGWNVYRVTSSMVRNGALGDLMREIKARLTGG